MHNAFIKKYKYILFFATVVISICSASAILKHHIKNPESYFINFSDWHLHLSWAASARQTMLEYKQIPLWNPFRCGGVPVIGDPESDLLSLYLPFLLYLGPVYGYIMLFVTSLIIGFFGFYLLARQHALSRLTSILSASLYMFSGLYVVPFIVGMTNFLAICYLPYVVLFYEKYLRTHILKDAVMAAFFIATMFLSGFHYIPIIILYIAMYSIIRAVVDRDPRHLYRCCIVLLFFAGFSAVKLIRTLDILIYHQGVTFTDESTLGYSMKSFLYSLLYRGQTFRDFSHIASNVPNILTGTSYDLDENGMYIGIIPFLLFFTGLKTMWTQARAYIPLLLIFLWIACGTNIVPSLYETIKTIPFLEDMRVAQRFRYIFMIPIVLCIGMGADNVLRRLKNSQRFHPKIVTIGATIAIILIVVDITRVNWFIGKDMFTITQIETTNKNFKQQCTQQSEYVVVVQNQGNLQCWDNVIYSIHAACSQAEHYRGRAYLYASHINVPLQYFSPNRIEIHTTIQEADALVINQNFGRNWQAKVNGKYRQTVNTNNLVSVPVIPGDQEIVFFFLPKLLIVGSIISILTIIVMLSILFMHYRLTKNKKR